MKKTKSVPNKPRNTKPKRKTSSGSLLPTNQVKRLKPKKSSPEARPAFNIESFNQMVGNLISKESNQPIVTKDWRALIASTFSLNGDQAKFFRGLPTKSVNTIQRIVVSIIKKGGKINLQKSATGDIDVLCENVTVMPAQPEIGGTFRICTFDANFRNCKWGIGF